MSKGPSNARPVQGPHDNPIMIPDNTTPIFALARFAIGRERESTRELAEVKVPLVGEKAVGSSEDACRANDARMGEGRRRA